MGCLNILHDAIDDMSSDEVKELIKTSIATGSHMVHLLNDILSQSKNRYLSTSKARGTVSYMEFAKGSVEGMRSLAANADVAFDLTVGENADLSSSSRITLDRTKSIQVISNITSNAITFSGPNGKVDVKFSLEDSLQGALLTLVADAAAYNGSVFMLKEDTMLDSIQDAKAYVDEITATAREGQKWFCFSVADTGIGMKPKEIVMMFEPYTQASTDRARTGVMGTGLGLFICMSLCRRLEGFIACSSTSGEGTVFHVGIPVEVQKDDSDTASQDSQEKMSTEEIVILGPIMIVDDNVLNIKILERQLLMQFKRIGIDIEIIRAGGGREAVGLYMKRFPSLLIVDYHMPDFDGLETMSTIRRIETERGLRPSYIISYTADATDNAAMLLLGAGANEMMLKPPPKDFVPNLVQRFRVQTATEILSRFT